MSTTSLAIAAGLLFADARRHDLPDPITAEASRIGEKVTIHLSSLADLAQWAQWAEATIEHEAPQPWPSDVSDRWVATSHAEGSIHELPVRLTATEFGRMAEAEWYECDRCGAAFGTSAGFVPDDALVDDSHELEVARHQDGACVGAAVTR